MRVVFGCVVAISLLVAAPMTSATPAAGTRATKVVERSNGITRPLPVSTAEHARHWSYQPIAPRARPRVANSAWIRNEIDNFILARLELERLEPAVEAPRRLLLRRAYLDILGIPPTVEEVEAFERDRAENAYEQRIDALLASPKYGERWGRHWLDVARYADSNGVDENIAYANAHHYRDYVIDAVNRDMPFDEFIVEQLAGDLIPEQAQPSKDDDARTRGRLAALSFLALGPKMLAEPDQEQERVDVVDEQIDVVSKAFLAQTISCARCHDHKFDPISQSDYFALSGVFRSVSTFDSIATVGRVAQRPLATAVEVQRSKDWHDRAQLLDKARNEAHANLRRREHDAHAQRLLYAIDRRDGNPWLSLALSAERGANNALPERDSFLAARASRDEHERAKPAPLPHGLVVKESKVDETPLHDRGDHTTPKGPTIPRGVPAIFDRTLAGPSFPSDASGRLELAHWIAHEENPLTARVIANRLWGWHFGVGIVDTPSNFGILGGKPSHPELLDFLALRFMQGGWSMKAMHRLLMTSATYRQASASEQGLPVTDPDNRLLSRFSRRRVEAEVLRDSVLWVSGALDTTMGGTLLSSSDHDYVTNDQSGNAANYDAPRRTVYLPVIRNAMFGLFTAFDYPDASTPIECRSRTTVAPQALFFMNAPFVEDAAKRIASLALEGGAPTHAQIQQAFRITLAREPTTEERTRSDVFLAALAHAGLAPDAALTRLCHTLLSTNEFVTME